MWKDEVIEQVIKKREKLFAKYDYDIKKFSACIIEAQKKETRKIVNLEDLKNQ